ncbi:MAG: folate family ECF transporter S component [Lachnospiraceae bacterium]|nr:folate family ECF transporter S component [Lachnospiraceae bacterium]
MKRLATLYTQSSQEIRQPRTIATCAMLAAVAIVLGYFSIELGSSLRIGFSSIPNRLVDYLFGPVVGAYFGGLLDIIKYIIKPTGTFFPGFTFNAMLAGLICGSILYGRKLTLWRVFLAKFLVIMICNVFFNTLWISILYGKAFMVLLPVRLFKNLVMWPIDSVILFMVGSFLERAGAFRLLKLKKSSG